MYDDNFCLSFSYTGTVRESTHEHIASANVGATFKSKHGVGNRRGALEVSGTSCTTYHFHTAPSYLYRLDSSSTTKNIPVHGRASKVIAKALALV